MCESSARAECVPYVWSRAVPWKEPPQGRSRGLTPGQCPLYTPPVAATDGRASEGFGSVSRSSGRGREKFPKLFLLEEAEVVTRSS